MKKSMVKINRIILFVVLSLLVSGFAFGQQNTTQQKVDALQLYYNGQYAQAIAACQQELIANPNNLDSYVVMCWVHTSPHPSHRLRLSVQRMHQCATQSKQTLWA